MSAQAPLISVVMPAHNAERTIGEAIRSLLAQDRTNWELIVVDDGSTDGTMQEVLSFQDERIRCIRQERGGVSRARNAGLDLAQGEYVAFLDADDRMPGSGLSARASLLQDNPGTAFVDGAVMAMDDRTGALERIHSPTYSGPPFKRLMRMDPGIFLGNTWMIRRSVIGTTRFPEGLTHGEDLAFYLLLARKGDYMATHHEVLHYRRGHRSAMADLDGLDNGYLALHRLAQRLVPPPDPADLHAMWLRIRRVMVRGYLKAMRPWDALRVWLRKPSWTT